MKQFLLLFCLLPTMVFAGGVPAVTGLTVSGRTITNETWLQTAMRDGDDNLYEISCNVGYTNWSFVGGGTNQLAPVYTDPLGNVIRDPGHIYYEGLYYLAYNIEQYAMGMAVSTDDVHWSYLGTASVGYGPHWSPKFFVDATNCLWCNVRWCYGLPNVYPYQQVCFRVDTSNPTNTINRDNRLVCANIWHQDNTDFPTAVFVCQNGLYYLFNQGGNIYCSPTLVSNNWTQIGTNVFGSTIDGPCIGKYQGVWYMTDSQNGSVRWFRSLDLTNWSQSTTASWTQFGLKEGTAVIHTALVPTVTLAWQPNYTATNQVTVVMAADSLLTPTNQWQVLFTGNASQLTLTNDRPARYFSVFNIATPPPPSP